MRTIIIHISPEEVYDLGNNTDSAELTEVFGYLATWGMLSTGYDTVNIHMDWHSKTDLVAIYTCKDNPTSRFTMGAVWRKDGNKFTFHS